MTDSSQVEAPSGSCSSAQMCGSQFWFNVVVFLRLHRWPYEGGVESILPKLNSSLTASIFVISADIQGYYLPLAERNAGI